MNEYANEGDVRDVLGVVGRRKWTLLATVATFIVLAAGFTLSQEKEYEATASVLVGPASALAGRSGGDAARELSNERLVLESEQVRNTVAARLDIDPDGPLTVEVTAGEEADVLDIVATGPDADLVAPAANAYAEVYFELRRSRAEQEITAARDSVALRIGEVTAALAAVVVDPAAPDPAAVEQRTFLLERLKGLQETADDLELQAATAFLDRDQVLVEAAAPDGPARPNLVQNLVIAAVVGLMAGLALALAREGLDRTVRADASLPVGEPLAVIPGDRTASRPGGAVSVATAEAYRSLRLVLEAAATERPMRVIQLASPAPTPLTAATAFHLGEAYRRAGNRVLLVSADMRTPHLHRFCGMDDSVGLATVLHDGAPLSSVVRAVHGDGAFLAIASGTRGDHSADLLSSKRMGEILEQLREHAEIIIVESGAVLPFADSMELASVTDAALLVVHAGATKLADVQRAHDKLGAVGEEPIGTVIHR